MRFLSVMLSLFLLAIGVLLAVVDATRCIAANEWVYTPLIDSWQAFAPSLLAAMELAIKSSSADFLWDKAVVHVLQAPGWAVFFVLAFVFHAAGWRRKKQNHFAHVDR